MRPSSSLGIQTWMVSYVKRAYISRRNFNVPVSVAFVLKVKVWKAHEPSPAGAKFTLVLALSSLPSLYIFTPLVVSMMSPRPEMSRRKGLVLDKVLPRVSTAPFNQKDRVYQLPGMIFLTVSE